MADDAAKTDAVKPGNQTSEWKLTLYVFVAGAVLEVAGTVLAAYAETSEKAWAHTTLVIVGALLQVLKAAGYVKSRSDLKVAAAANSGKANSADVVAAVLPLVTAAMQKVADAKAEADKQQHPPPPAA